MATILIVEDDVNLKLLINERLREYYTTILANNGQEAIDLIYSKNIDLIITDIMMPKMNGFDLLKMIRQDGKSLPVLILTAKQSFHDKKSGFEFGTDDYMTKPVNFDELRWRVDALLRRSNIALEHTIQIGNVLLNEKSYTLSREKDSWELPIKEFQLLYKLLSYPGIIFTKNQLLDQIWGYNSESSEDTVKTHISRLRNKIADFKEFEIITIKGLGYKSLIHRL